MPKELSASIETQAEFRSVDIPQQYHDRPLLRGGPYFTIPVQLLKRVLATVGEDRFDSELLEMEFALSDVCEDHSNRIGFWGGNAINYPLLRPDNDLAGSDFLVRGLMEDGKTDDEALEILTLGGQRLDRMSESRRGYCGWLLTNPEFLQEHNLIFRNWAEQVAKTGVPGMGPVVHDIRAVSAAERAEGENERLLEDFEQFFMRWRLDAMPAPFAPLPIGPHLPVNDLAPVFGHMHCAGMTFYIPDISPVPNLHEIRKMVEEALRDVNAPKHLGEWFDIVRSDNVAKNQVRHYARIFDVQHYMRALHARHATALQRKKTALTVALAEFLGVSADTIERDLSLIASRLNSDWYLSST